MNDNFLGCMRKNSFIHSCQNSNYSIFMIQGCRWSDYSNNFNSIFHSKCADDRILEYDIDKVLFDSNSPFQKVQIVHSKSLGNMLVLDELQSKQIE